nr:MAG TPA: hypothetical protein [Caudoviricetes sp.]
MKPNVKAFRFQSAHLICCRKKVLLFTSVRHHARWLKWLKQESCQPST